MSHQPLAAPPPLAVSIGVDALFMAKGSWWSHLICDDFSPTGLAVLHEFARRIGLAERSFHNPPNGDPRPHYDLRPEFREKAVLAGARELSMREFVAFLNLGRQKLGI